MPEWLTELFASDPSYSYLIVAVLFVLCGLGLPLPEEIVLVTAGYICYQGHAVYWIMTSVCAGAILLGDIIPFALGTMFGPRLLRLRWLRLVVNRQRLAMFDRWFRRRGDMVILIARFIPGLRVVAFFTGGTMRMKWARFLILDLCGIALVAPAFVFIGWHFGDTIDEALAWVKQVEDSILILAGLGAGIFGVWYWLRLRVKRRRLVAGPRETFVEPTPVASDAQGPPDADPAGGSAKKKPAAPKRSQDAVPPVESPAPDRPRGAGDGPADSDVSNAG